MHILESISESDRMMPYSLIIIQHHGMLQKIPSVSPNSNFHLRSPSFLAPESGLSNTEINAIKFSLQTPDEIFSTLYWCSNCFWLLSDFK